jgi:hypothetical protein
VDRQTHSQVNINLKSFVYTLLRVVVYLEEDSRKVQAGRIFTGYHSSMRHRGNSPKTSNGPPGDGPKTAADPRVTA